MIIFNVSSQVLKRTGIKKIINIVDGSQDNKNAMYNKQKQNNLKLKVKKAFDMFCTTSIEPHA